MSTENTELLSGIITRLEQLRLQQDELVAEVRAIRRGEAQQERTQSADASAAFPYEVGDIVHVNNGRRRIPASDRVAEVTHIAGQRVHFVTTGGLRTWRSPKNLTLIRRPPKQHVSNANNTSA